MTDSLEDVHSAFERDPDFGPREDGYDVTSTPFSTSVRVELADDDAVVYTVEADLPSLDAAVVDDTVSDTLIEGWAEPMERRLGDAHQATSLPDVQFSCSWNRQRFVATFRFRQPLAAPAPLADIRALAGYVEGTYLQGTIPGYSYRPPVDDLLEKARDRASSADTP